MWASPGGSSRFFLGSLPLSLWVSVRWSRAHRWVRREESARQQYGPVVGGRARPARGEIGQRRFNRRHR